LVGMECSSGWPSPHAMRYFVEWRGTKPVYRGSLAAPPVLVPKDQFGDRHALPLMPVWPGFAIDVLFWGLVSWLLFFAPFTLRRVVRARRGRCVKCGYDMRGLDACPECGAAP
jgi:hypothetical protein